VNSGSDNIIRTLIVDDEPMARATIRLLLKDDADVELAGECADGFEAIEAIDQHQPDLVFLDVQMPEMNGFEVVNNLPGERLPFFIFVTAYDEYALRAFDVNAVDYLLKPFDDERFAVALRRAKEQIQQKQANVLSARLFALLKDYGSGSAPAHRDQYLQRLAIKSGGQISLLPVDEIDWIEAADQYVELHVGAKGHLLRQSMNHLEQKLDPEKFCRIHRSAIVKLDRITELIPNASGDWQVVLADGTKLRLSRSRRQQLQSLMGLQP
jgi:two-component system LytT family response regulator